MKSDMNYSANSSNIKLISIRLLGLGDVNALYNLIDESRIGLQNLTWSQTATLESTIKFITSKNESEDKIHGVYQNKILIGILELRKRDFVLELGYWLGNKYRGKGLMRIAVKLLVDENIKTNTIVAHIRENNSASLNVLKYARLVYDHTELWNNEKWLHLKRNKE